MRSSRLTRLLLAQWLPDICRRYIPDLSSARDFCPIAPTFVVTAGAVWCRDPHSGSVRYLTTMNNLTVAAPEWLGRLDTAIRWETGESLENSHAVDSHAW